VPSYRETEIKLRVDDLAALIRKLKRLGVNCHGRVLERNTLFDTPDSDFRRRSRLLRLRVETPAGSSLIAAGPPRAWLTSKQPARASAPVGYKQNLESEAPVAAPEYSIARFRALGFRPAFRYEKFRTSFRLGQLHLDLDETPVGTFLELEGDPRQIDRAADALGYSPRDYIRGTYWDLYAADCRRRGKIPRDMLFRAQKIGNTRTLRLTNPRAAVTYSNGE
jgi:adenylate cyclase, class 2